MKYLLYRVHLYVPNFLSHIFSSIFLSIIPTVFPFVLHPPRIWQDLSFLCLLYYYKYEAGKTILERTKARRADSSTPIYSLFEDRSNANSTPIC
jgi:hypothetical protein